MMKIIRETTGIRFAKFIYRLIKRNFLTQIFFKVQNSAGEIMDFDGDDRLVEDFTIDEQLVDVNDVEQVVVVHTRNNNVVKRATNWFDNQDNCSLEDADLPQHVDPEDFEKLHQYCQKIVDHRGTDDVLLQFGLQDIGVDVSERTVNFRNYQSKQNVKERENTRSYVKGITEDLKAAGMKYASEFGVLVEKASLNCGVLSSQEYKTMLSIFYNDQFGELLFLNNFHEIPEVIERNLQTFKKYILEEKLNVDVISAYAGVTGRGRLQRVNKHKFMKNIDVISYTVFETKCVSLASFAEFIAIFSLKLFEKKFELIDVCTNIKCGFDQVSLSVNSSKYEVYIYFVVANRSRQGVLKRMHMTTDAIPENHVMCVSCRSVLSCNIDSFIYMKRHALNELRAKVKCSSCQRYMNPSSLEYHKLVNHSGEFLKCKICVTLVEIKHFWRHVSNFHREIIVNR